MNQIEKALLREQVGDTAPTLVIRSHTKIDAGRWWRKTSVWLCVVGDEFITLAVARRRHLEKIAIAQCSGSHYNPSSGELVIEPGENLRYNRFKTTPREAITILKIINSSSITRTLQN